MNRIACGLLALVTLLASEAAFAQVTIKDAWARGTVPLQKASGLFMQVTSAKGGRLVGASSPVAGAVEIHEMAMKGEVMTMRELPNGLVLPAGRPVDLASGGYHVMLLDLKQPLKAGDSVPFTLTVQGDDGTREQVQGTATVRALGEPQHMAH